MPFEKTRAAFVYFVLILCVIGGTLFFAIGLATFLDSKFVPKDSGQLASWAQAAGSVVAIFVAYWMGADQARNARRMAAREEATENVAAGKCEYSISRAFNEVKILEGLNQKEGLFAFDAHTSLTPNAQDAFDRLSKAGDNLSRDSTTLHTRLKTMAAIEKAETGIRRALKLKAARSTLHVDLVQSTLDDARENIEAAWQHFSSAERNL